MGFEDFNVSNISSIIAIASIVVFFLRILLDTFGMFDVEKIVMTNFMKFTIYVSHILLFSFCFFALLVISGDLEEATNPKIYLIISFVIVFLLYSAVRILMYFLSIKTIFYVLDENTKERWFIKKMIGSNKLLLYRDSNRFKFHSIDNMDDKVIYRIYKKKKSIPGQNTIASNFLLTVVILAFMLIINAVISFVIAERNLILDTVLLSLVLVEYLSIFYIYVAFNNSKVMKEIDQSRFQRIEEIS